MMRDLPTVTVPEELPLCAGVRVAGPSDAQIAAHWEARNPCLSIGRGRWIVTIQVIDRDGIAQTCLSPRWYDDGMRWDLMELFPGTPSSACATLVDWTVDPADLVGRSAEEVAPFLSSPSDSVRLTALRALGLIMSPHSPGAAGVR